MTHIAHDLIFPEQIKYKTTSIHLLTLTESTPTKEMLSNWPDIIF